MSQLRVRHPEQSVSALCSLFGKTRQAYYKPGFDREALAFRQAFSLQLVNEIRADHPRIGTRKLRYLLAPKLEEHGIEPLGRDRLFDLLSAHGLLVRRRRRRAKTTDSQHGMRTWPDLTKTMELCRVEQLWVADITYVRLEEGFAYLSLVTDAYSRLVVGHCLHPTLEAVGPRSALAMALSQRRTDRLLIHHSDRGSQYCSRAYVDDCQDSRTLPSMTRDGSPYDNALAERMNGILKQEYRLGETFGDFEEARAQTRKAVGLYNTARPHLALDMLTPQQAHLRALAAWQEAQEGLSTSLRTKREGDNSIQDEADERQPQPGLESGLTTASRINAQASTRNRIELCQDNRI